MYTNSSTSITQRNTRFTYSSRVKHRTTQTIWVKHQSVFTSHHIISTLSIPERSGIQAMCAEEGRVQRVLHIPVTRTRV